MSNERTEEALVKPGHPIVRMRLDVKKLRTARPKSPRLFDPEDEVVPFLPRDQRPRVAPIGEGRGYMSWH